MTQESAKVEPQPDKPTDWDRRWKAYQDHLAKFPGDKDQWRVFHAGCEAGVAAVPPTPTEEIIPPIEIQHGVAKRIAREHDFEPNSINFPRCVGAVMQAWRPGKLWAKCDNCERLVVLPNELCDRCKGDYAELHPDQFTEGIPHKPFKGPY